MIKDQPRAPAKLDAKRRILKDKLHALESVVVAYSGGVDSAFLAKMAFDVLGSRALAVTACSETYTASEREEAVRLAREFGIPHRVVETSECGKPEFVANPPDRCYHCKQELFQVLRDIARKEGFAHVADGTTTDDLRDIRPGRRAAAELQVCSPLLDAGLGKDDVRALSKELGLPGWDRPAAACLASRIPYGEPITPEKLRQVDEAETFLRSLGLRHCRVRRHGAVARIEVPLDDIARVASELRHALVPHFRELGFTYVTLDLAGYRTGSMNEALGVVTTLRRSNDGRTNDPPT